MLPIICSYYTLDTPYAQVAHIYLMPSIQKLGLPSDIRGVENLGSWERNTSYKATFVQQMLCKYQSNIVFVDCDAEIREQPTLFQEIPEQHSLAFHYLDRGKWYNAEDTTLELLSGTSFFRYCDETLKVVERWKQECATHPRVWEQRLLGRVIEEENVKPYILPIEYCYINSLPNGNEPHVKVEKPVIVHHQASRLYRNKI